MGGGGRGAERERIVFAALEQAANNNLPCPSNADLAELIGAVSNTGGVNAVAALERKGLIQVQRFAIARVVTIVATGKKTLYSGSNNPHWRLPGHLPPARPDSRKRREKPVVAVTEVLPPIVNRDPCPRCGIRADIGCAHNASRITMGAFA